MEAKTGWVRRSIPIYESIGYVGMIYCIIGRCHLTRLKSDVASVFLHEWSLESIKTILNTIPEESRSGDSSPKGGPAPQQKHLSMAGALGEVPQKEGRRRRHLPDRLCRLEVLGAGECGPERGDRPQGCGK